MNHVYVLMFYKTVHYNFRFANRVCILWYREPCIHNDDVYGTIYTMIYETMYYK